MPGGAKAASVWRPSRGGGQRPRFPRSARLLKGREFRRVFKRAVRSSDGTFKVLARLNDRGAARLGLAVSKRVDKRASVRNRIKRVTRESFRHHRSSLDSLDCVVIAQPGARRCSNEELFRALERHWARLRRRAERQ